MYTLYIRRDLHARIHAIQTYRVYKWRKGCSPSEQGRFKNPADPTFPFRGNEQRNNIAARKTADGLSERGFNGKTELNDQVAEIGRRDCGR